MKLLSLLLLLLAPCAHAAGRFELMGSVYMSHCNGQLNGGLWLSNLAEKVDLPADLLIHALEAQYPEYSRFHSKHEFNGFVPFGSLTLRRVSEKGFSFGVKAILPLRTTRENFSLPEMIIPGSPSIMEGSSCFMVPLPGACIAEIGLPLLQVRAFNLSTAFGIGGAYWGTLPFGSAQLHSISLLDTPEIKIQARLNKWTLAYSALMNFDWNLGHDCLLRASAGYVCLGSVSREWFKISAGAMTFGLGLGIKL